MPRNVQVALCVFEKETTTNSTKSIQTILKSRIFLGALDGIALMSWPFKIITIQISSYRSSFRICQNKFEIIAYQYTYNSSRRLGVSVNSIALSPAYLSSSYHGTQNNKAKMKLNVFEQHRMGSIMIRP